MAPLLKKVRNISAPSLLVIGLVVAGASYAVINTNVNSTSDSLLAAAESSGKPFLWFTQNPASPTGDILPLPNQVLAVFDVVSVNAKVPIDIGPMYLRMVRKGKGQPDFSLGNYSIEYETCTPECTKTVYRVGAKSLVVPMPNSKYSYKGTITVHGTPVYNVVYNEIGAGNAVANFGVGSPLNMDALFATNPLVQVYAENFLQTMPGTSSAKKHVASKTNRTVVRGSGYGYGVYDMNNDNALNSLDVTMLMKVANGSASCPSFKTCDVDKNTKVTQADALMLAKYASGALKPPVQ